MDWAPHMKFYVYQGFKRHLMAKQGREYDVFLTTNAMDTSLRGDVLRVLHDPALAEAWNLRQISREFHCYDMYSNFNDTTWYNYS